MITVDDLNRAVMGNDEADIVNQPNHYTQGKMQCWDAIEGMLGDHAVHAYRANVLKYVWRYQDKGGVVDLEKARVYLDRIIKLELESDA